MRKILKAAWKKRNITYKGLIIRLLTDLIITVNAERQWDNIFKGLKGKNCPLYIQKSFIS